jgi:hypothetical protein
MRYFNVKEGKVGRSLPLVLVSCALLLAGYVGTASADPLKNNRLEIPASCKEDGEDFTFVINGQGIAGHIIGSTSNIQPVEDTVTYTYRDPTTRKRVKETVIDSLGSGEKTGLQSDLKRCSGTVSYEDPELGPVTADFDILAYFTPRGGG